MEEEGLPLRRRVPGAEREGPGPFAPPRLPDSVLARMQAAVEAAKTEPVDRAVEHDADTAPIPPIGVQKPGSGTAVSSANGKSAATGPAAVQGVQVDPERAARPRRFSNRRDATTVGQSQRDRGARLKRMARATGTAATKSAGKARPSSESGPTELPTRTVPTPARQLQPPALPAAAAPTSVTAPPKVTAEAQPTTLPKRIPSVRDTKSGAVLKPAEGAPPKATPWPAAEPEPATLPKRSVSTASKPAAEAERPEGTTAAVRSRAPSAPSVPRSPAAPGLGKTRSRSPDELGARLAAVEALPRQRAQHIGSRHHKRRRTTWMVASALVLLAGGAGVFALHGAPPAAGGSPSPLQRQTARYEHEAAAWIRSQVTPGTTVACDKQMCSALTASGISAQYLDVLGSTSPPPVGSDLIIETTAVRSLFGTTLDTRVAPTVLTTIGSGQAEITIRAIAPDGASAYQQKLIAGRAARQQNEEAVLQGTSRITTSPAAKKAIDDGDPDARLILAITDLAASLPIHIVDFGSEATNPSADLPLRYVDLADNDAAAHMTSSAYVAAIRLALSRVPAAYRPRWEGVVPLPGGLSVLRMDVLAPSPPGFAY